MADQFELQPEMLGYMDSNPPQVGSVVVAQELSLAVTGQLLLIRGICCDLPAI